MKDQEQPSNLAAARVRQSSVSVAVVGDDGAMVGASSLALVEPYHDRKIQRVQ